MKRTFVLSALLIAIPLTAFSAEFRDEDIKKLQEQIEQLQGKVAKMEQKIGDEPAEESDTDRGSSAPERVNIERVMQIEYRPSFNDKQEAAPRPYDLTLDPSYRGFIPIPHTHGMIMFNARPRVDSTFDNTYTGNRNMFTVGTIPVTGDPQKGGGMRYNMNAQGSQLSIDVRAPNTMGDPRFYYENDFSGSGNAYMNYKLRHLYGQFFNFVVGQTYTVFEDPDAWPDTVDYEGPNSMISARRPLVRYSLLFNDELGMTFSIEMPDAQVDTYGDPSAVSENHAPEGGFYIKWARKGVGHFQLSTIFREIGVKGDIVGKQEVFGWGVSLSGNLDAFRGDTMQFQACYGQGIFYFMNDATTYNDAAFNSSNDLVPLPVVALMGAYTHYWSKKFRSTASFGFVNLENEVKQQWNAYHRTYYASGNLVYQLYKRLSFGAELLYGHNTVKSGASGQAFRGQLTVMYALFR